MDETFILNITTLTSVIAEDINVKSITVPSDSGVLTILPHHQPLIVGLSFGELLITDQQNKISSYYVEYGLMKISNNSVEIILDLAEESDKLVAKHIEEAIKNAESKIKTSTSLEEKIALESQLRREFAKLEIIKK